MSPTIETRNLTLRYGTVTAVDDLSLRLEGGRIYGLVGRNGSGKTSLLSVLAAFRPATSGEVLIDGAPVWENPDAVDKICLIRETCDTVVHNWPTDKVKHALEFAGELRSDWDADFGTSLAERFRLPMDQRVEELSRGQRSALGVTLGLASRSPVTLLDESYLGLDAAARQAFYESLLDDFMAHPRTIVLSTHLIEEVSSLLEEIVIIDEGKLLLHEEVEAMRARGATFIGPVEDVDRVTDGLTVLGERRLGPTKAATVYGQLDEAHRDAARQVGVTLEPVAIQDLFVHLTEPKGARR